MSENKFPQYPRVTPKTFIRWNERMFQKYNNERVYEHINPIIRFIEKKRVEKIISYLKPLNTRQQILAAGSGEGYIEKRIPNAKITLVDISEEAIKRAKKNLLEDKRYRFVKANIEKLPFAKNAFDKIECSEVIEHVISPQKILKEMHRVIKDNGLLVISFPNEPLINTIKKLLLRLHIFHLFFPGIPDDMTEEWHLRSYTLEQFKRDSNVFWSIEKISGIPFVFLPIRYVVLCKKR